MPDGSIFNGLKRLRKDNAGYDLRHLLIGSEGTLGVITAASLRLYPIPAASVVAMLAVPSPAAALDLLGLAQGRLGSHGLDVRADPPDGIRLPGRDDARHARAL